ncbi:MAG: carboxymuconolactone decarboxylase family protein [Desulfobacteraceae bacterium]
MENQTELLEAIHRQFLSYKDRLPRLGEAYDHLSDEAYKEGALSPKVKRLMALCVALTHGCRACVLYQAQEALNLGASVEEVMETCGVAISIGGTMAAGETTRVIQFLGEKGLVESS